MVSDQELARYVESLVRQAAAAFPGGTAGISPEAVVRQLEAQLGVDLSPKAPLIRDILLALLAPAPRAGALALALAAYEEGPLRPSPALPSSSPSAFFSPPQQLHGYASLPPQPSPQYQQQRGSALSSYDASGSAAFRYAQPFAQAGGTQAGVAHLQRLMQQQEAATAAATVAAAATAAATAASSQKESATTGVKRRGGPGGLNKVCGVSPELQAIVGEPTMARTEIVKQLWAYIRRNNLQDPNNKRKIICNDELRLVFETDCTDMFKMNKLLAKHIIPLESRKGSNRDSKKLKPVASEPIFCVKDDTNRLPITVSDALANFFGTGEREMLQSEAVSRIWGHIKSNNLEDPTNPTMILCDSKLKELFGCDSIPALGLSELLSCHLFKQS